MGDSGFQQAQCGLPRLPPWAGHHSSQVLFPTEVSHKIPGSQGLTCSASAPSRTLKMGGKVRTGGEASCQLYFSSTGHSGSPLLALCPPPLLIKLIMNTARGHLTPEIHVKIKYFRNTSI